MSENTKNPDLSCSQVRERYDLLAAGDLSAAESARCLEHIDHCAECQAEYARVAVSVSDMQAALQATAAPMSETFDVWPAIRGEITPASRRGVLRWLTLEPVRALAIAGALTLGLYLAVSRQVLTSPNLLAGVPVYESSAVVVQSAEVEDRPARVMGVESSDGETVFLWLE